MRRLLRIGIIGAGHIGGTLAREFAAAGHQVAIAGSGGHPRTLERLAGTLGERVRPVDVAEAARFGPVALLAIPFGRYAELPTAEFTGRIVIDATNYLPERDGHRTDLDTGRTTSSELVQAHLPGARLVKAFNTMRWDHLRDFGHEAGAVERYGIPLAGDDDHAKWTVADLIEQLGYHPVDAGDLAGGGRRLQSGGPVFLADLTAGELQAALGAPVPSFRSGHPYP
ncbi:NADPH-dependent F420 reductase [Micromonospora zhanjiangensis]|uniref:NADPH-dependent F420 reductase n=1 Tax=Micromonospora zhanjiangensis TaxID=1522057 RepID=A0ABV8KNG4_9ACTN